MIEVCLTPNLLQFSLMKGFSIILPGSNNFKPERRYELLTGGAKPKTSFSVPV